MDVVALNPFPTASGAGGCNEILSTGSAAGEPAEAFVYAGAIAFSVGAPGNTLDNLLVEEAIDYGPAISVLRRSRTVEEHDFGIGGPFGA